MKAGQRVKRNIKNISENIDNYKRNGEESSKKSRKWRILLEILPVVLIITTIFIFHKKLAGILIPLIFGGIVAYMVEPSVKFLHEKLNGRFNIKRNVCVIIVFLFYLLLFVGVISFAIPVIVSNVTDILENIDNLQEKIIDYFKNIVSDEHPELQKKINNIILEMSKQISQKGENVLNAATNFSTYSKISQFVIGLVTTLVFAYYILRDKLMFRKWFLGIFPYRLRGFATETAREIGNISAKFIKGQFMVAFIVGVIETVGLMLLRVPYSIFFGLIGGISNMIPYFGPFIGGVLPVIAAFMISPFKAICVLILFLGVQQIDNHFISPKVIEGNLGIHPVTVIVVILIGQEFFGVVGILMAVPVYAILKCIFIKILVRISA